MACGAPVIATRTGAIPEYADGAALLVDPGDRDALRDALDPHAARQIAAARAARARAGAGADVHVGSQRGADDAAARRGGAMRIGIDARKIADFGIGTYIRGLLRELVARDGGDTYVAFAPERVAHLLPAGVEHVARRRAALLDPRARRPRPRRRPREARSLSCAALRRAVHARAVRRHRSTISSTSAIRTRWRGCTRGR